MLTGCQRTPLELWWHPVQQNRSISTSGCTCSIMSHTVLCIYSLHYAALFFCKFKQLLRLLEALRVIPIKPQLSKQARLRLWALWPGGAASIASTLQQGAFNISSLDPREALYSPSSPYRLPSHAQTGTHLSQNKLTEEELTSCVKLNDIPTNK